VITINNKTTLSEFTAMIKTIDVSHLNSQQIEEISNLIKLFENENKLTHSQSKQKNYLSDSEIKLTLKNDNLAERIKQRFKDIDNVEIPIIERDQIRPLPDFSL